jgi:seryl-tRNA synthetase
VTLVTCHQTNALLDHVVLVCTKIDERDAVVAQTGLSVLMAWLDRSFEKMARDAGAKRIEVSDWIDKAALETAGFFESFPAEKLVDMQKSTARTPAVCYQCYPRLSGHELDDLGLWNCAAECGRNEDQRGIGRFQTFHMREIVLVGSARRVRDAREAWMSKIIHFAQSLGLNAALQPAADCFFAARETRGRKLLQQVKELKFELQVSAEGPCAGMAIASFNLHETFFAHRFDLKLSNGSEAYSGCVAFGLERWVLALVQQLGPDRAFALAGETDA